MRLLDVDGLYLASRGLWLAVALGVLAFTVWRFRFELTGTRRRTWRVPFLRTRGAVDRTTPDAPPTLAGDAETGRRGRSPAAPTFGWAT